MRSRIDDRETKIFDTDTRALDPVRTKPLRDKFFVQPMPAVVAPPNLSARKSAGNSASGDDDRP
jgi:hypothetical protein